MRADVLRGSYVGYPRVRITVDDQGVTGPLELAFPNGRRCHVSVPNGYINTRSERLSYRGRDYLPSVHVQRLSNDGAPIVWGLDEADRNIQSLSAPPTHAAVIMRVILDAVARVGTWEVIDEATYHDAMLELKDADTESDRIAARLVELRAEQRRLRRVATKAKERIDARATA